MESPPLSHTHTHTFYMHIYTYTHTCIIIKLHVRNVDSSFIRLSDEGEQANNLKSLPTFSA